MLKVVIIDDETLVRVGLKSLINWEEHGYEIVGEEDSGEGGLKLIKDLKPDIVITDIKMPGMDGLEMMQKALEFDKGLRFIVLSSYNEFNLVKQAMKLGAGDYLLKLEMKPELLINILSNVRNKIAGEMDTKDERVFIEGQIRMNKNALREEFFKNLIGSIFPDREYIDGSLKYLGIGLDEKTLACALVKANFNGVARSYSGKDMKLLDFSILNIIEEISNEFFTSYAFKWDHGIYAIIFAAAEDGRTQALRGKTNDMCEVLVQMLKQYVNIDIAVGISDLHSGFENLAAAFSEGSQAIERLFFYGYGSVIYFSDITDDKFETFDFDIHKYKDDLLKAIELSDAEAIKSVFGSILDMFRSRRISRECAFDTCCRLAYFISVSMNRDWDVLKESTGLCDNMFESIRLLETFEDLTKWIVNFEERLCTFLSGNKGRYEHHLITRAKKYISENYSDSLSLDKVAAYLNLSPKYFSSVFKQYTGVCFIDYVTGIKVDMAKKLLKESNYKIYEISDMLGYENACYFSRVFKKSTGVTPKEFVRIRQV